MNPALNWLEKKLPPKLNNTLLIRLFGLAKVPMIFWLRPVAEELTEEKCIVKIPLNRRSKNHLNSMYFGALCAGADIAGGLLLMNLVKKQKVKFSFVFKDFKANFLKRAEGDTLFTCTDGAIIKNLFERALNSGERENELVKVIATTPSKLGIEPVAEFELTLSIKKQR